MKVSSGCLFVTATAIAILLCGCGDAKSSSDSAKTTDAEQVQAFKFTPKVMENAVLALGLDLDIPKWSKVAQGSFDRMVGLLGKEDDERAQESRRKFKEFLDDPFKNAPADIREFAEEAGLRKARFAWAVASVENDALATGTSRLKTVPGTAVAIATDIDIKKLVACARRKFEEGGDLVEASIVEVPIAGEKAWRIVPKKKNDTREFAEKNLDPHVTSLDGQLLLIASTPSVLERQVRLYREGTGAGPMLHDFMPAKGDLVRVQVKDVGENIRKAQLDPRMLFMVALLIRNGDKVLFGLKDLDVRLTPSGGENLELSLDLLTASAEDAGLLKAFAKTSQKKIVGGLEQEGDMPKALVDVVRRISIATQDAALKITSDDAFFLQVSILYPTVFAAVTTANATAKLVDGRALVMGIVRASVGDESYWPRTGKASSLNKGDFGGWAAASAVDYFNALFDMKGYGTAEWDPVVDKELLGRLGKDAVDGKTIRAAGLDWCIAANSEGADVPDFFPVLISANFNPSLLPRSWDGHTDASKRLPIGSASGAAKSLFRDKAIVIVRKNGGAEVIKAKDLTYRTLFRRSGFALPGESPFVFLTPTGIARLKD